MSGTAKKCEVRKDATLTASSKDLVRPILISQLRRIRLPRFLQNSKPKSSVFSQSRASSYTALITILTNLIATVWLFSRFVPSKMTPKEPSPC